MDQKKTRRLAWHRFVWVTFMPIVQFFLRIRYGPFTFEPGPELPGSYIVLANHSCGADQFFVAFGFPKRQMYFLASEHAFRNPLLGFIMRVLTGPISRTKGGADASAVLSLLRWLRAGVPICFFPEGHRNWSGRTDALHPTTAKLLRTAGVPVLIYRIEGGYLSDPRWAHTLRRGKLHGRVVRIYQPEELKRMTPLEIDQAVGRDLQVDVERMQAESPIPYRGRRLAEGLEDALFLCPRCGKLDTLRSRNDRVFCTCGLEAVYNELGLFNEGAPFPSVAQWDDWQQARLAEMAEDTTLSDDGAELWQLGARHKTRLLERGRLQVDRNGLRLGQHFFPLERLQKPELCTLGRSLTMMFSSAEGSFELRFRQRPNLRKYQLLISTLLDRCGQAARS